MTVGGRFDREDSGIAHVSHLLREMNTMGTVTFVLCPVHSTILADNPYAFMHKDLGRLESGCGFQCSDKRSAE